MAIGKITTIRKYSDLDLNFNVHPVKKDINKLTGEMAVIGSIKNLLLTSRYERPFQPYIGSDIRKTLFEPMDKLTATILEKNVRTTIENFEPRAKIKEITVSPDFDKNAYFIILTFFILNRTEPITIEFFLRRDR